MSFASLVELVEARAAASPHRLAMTFGNGDGPPAATVTYASLAVRARSVAAALRAAVPAGDARVLILCPPGLDFVAAFLGALHAGLCAVPVYPPDPARLERTLPRLAAILADATPAALLTVAGFSPFIDQFGPLAALPRIAVDAVDARSALAWQAPAVGADSLAALQYTSGSSGAPKGVMLAHGNLLHNLEMIRLAFDTGPESVGVIWLPPFHDMGLVGGILHPIYAGFPVHLMSPLDFLRRPMRWLEMIARHRATISGGPNFAYELAARKASAADRERLDLSSWRVAFSGAEPVRPDTLARFAESFAPAGFRTSMFYPTYGLAEATLIATGGAVGDEPVVDGKHVGCGHAWLGQSVRVVDPETRTPVADGTPGEIWISGASVARGYWNRPELSAATFGAPLGDGRAYLRTGDLGYLRGGELHVSGRAKDLIILAGVKHHPEDLERTVEKLGAPVRPGGCAAFALPGPEGERAGIAVEVEGGDHPEVAARIRAAIDREHGLPVHAVALLAPRSLPKTSSGKLQRHACRAAYEAGQLAPLHLSTLGAAR